MKIIAHRGKWKSEKEQNTLVACQTAFQDGFGIETDLRDYEGNLVVSHDPATKQAVLADEVFSIYQDMQMKVPLALNVKADGIQSLLMTELRKYDIQNYFLFDMSVPEMIVNERMQLNYFTRQSDVEPYCVAYDNAKGVWMDAFSDLSFYTEGLVTNHLNNDKWVCIVSPELHGMSPMDFWHELLTWDCLQDDRLLLCTDEPDWAKELFL